MAGTSAEDPLVQTVYASLKAACCPLVEGLYLQDPNRMLHLLCTPSQQRTDILAWICSRINPNFARSKTMAERASDPNGLMKDMAMLGQDLLLCRAEDLDLIRGDASPVRQLELLQQLLVLVSGCQEPAGPPPHREALLNQLFTAGNLPNLTEMLHPALPTCPERIKLSGDAPEVEPADVDGLLRSAQAQLEELHTQCEFGSEALHTPAGFTPSSLRVASSDLRQLMAAFSHVYQSDLKEYCGREAPSCSANSSVFHRALQLLLACNTELDMLKEACEACACVTEVVQQLQTQPEYWSSGAKCTLPDQLEEVSRTVGELLCQPPS